ncbi:RING-type E3 ubiquitin-protein ligase ppil2, partial [Cichlidogyrus casuarinus]
SKVETQREAEWVEIRVGVEHSRTSLSHSSVILGEECCPWPIPVPTPTSRNCNLDYSGDLTLLCSFITFRTCKHLDKKHTIFGKVVGGLDTLDKVEWIPTDDKDQPLEQIKILATQVFVDPFKEADETLLKEREEQKTRETAYKGSSLDADRFTMVNGIPMEIKPGNRREEEALEALQRSKRKDDSAKVDRPDCVGKFIDAHLLQSGKRVQETNNLESETTKKKRKMILKSTLSDFSSW